MLIRDLYAQWCKDLATGERERRDAIEQAAEIREQRELTKWTRALRS